MPPLLEMEEYSVAWIAPLAIEAAAAIQLLDEHHGVPARKPGQTLVYHLGRMEDHNVAIVCFPAGECGIGVAGFMAAEVKRDLPHLEIGLLVGIGAGIPSSENDIHLGDVAVAVPDGDNAGVIGYDLVKIEPEEVRLKQWQNGSHSMLRSAISTPRLPIVHHGTILSGNKVIKSELYRDEMSRKYKAIAMEMEAAGIMNALPVAVIRGVSDFGDSKKNDLWQPYAAATAAAYAKELFKVLGPLEKVQGRLPDQKAQYD
ncbi:hypothetical protein N7470_003450 [Penicillium chermesinum]|nr:hypothetical protein N7470_003450 [Penicillium chermesinum]